MNLGPELCGFGEYWFHCFDTFSEKLIFEFSFKPLFLTWCMIKLQNINDFINLCLYHCSVVKTIHPQMNVELFGKLFQLKLHTYHRTNS